MADECECSFDEEQPAGVDAHADGAGDVELDFRLARGGQDDADADSGGELGGVCPTESAG